MSTDTYNRKLTAILYADIVDYSRLTGSDEEGTHRRVMSILDAAGDDISGAGGTVLRSAGDAILAVFPSALAAVKTAIAVQARQYSDNLGLAEAQRISMRIGVNLGDVIEDRGEVYGDGVNLAARLEAIAKPDGVCVAAGVHDQLIGKSDAIFVDGGEVELKNINRPVRIYHWVPAEGGARAEVHEPEPSRPSIAVLALVNMSSDPEQEYLGDGITEDLITALSKIRSFRVISRESTFSYKNQSIDVRQVARELDVRYVLEGSVRKAGNRVRVTVQLIDADTGHHVWAEKYDREMADIFDLQDEMVEIIAGALEPELNAVERDRALRKPPDNLDAWELYQRALWHMWTYEQDKVDLSMKLFRQAMKADPGFAPAHAYYAYCCYQTVIMGYADDPAARLEEGLQSAKNALNRDDKDAISYFAIGRIHMMQGNHDASVAALRKSIELNPCFAQAYHGLGMALMLSSEFEESSRCTGKAVAISPRDPMLWAFTIVHALNYILAGNDQSGLEWAEKADQNPNATGYWCPAVRAAALANLGRLEEGRAALEKAVSAKPDLSIDYLDTNLPTKQPGALAPYLEGLKRCGLE